MNTHVIALQSLASIAIIWVGLFWLYRDYRVDLFRQRMFALRDELFDVAANGDIPFNHKAYGMLRVTMNGFIRFAHLFNLGYFLLVAVRHPHPSVEGQTFSRQLMVVSEGLSPEQRNILKKFYERMIMLVVRHIIMSSPILLVTLIVPLFCWFALRTLVDKALEAFREPIDEMSGVAFVAGDDGA